MTIMDDIREAQLKFANTRPVANYKVQEVKPIPVYKNIFIKAKKVKGKRRGRMQRCRVFSHWVELIENGQVIKDEINSILYMNTETLHEFNQKVKQASPNKSPYYPISMVPGYGGIDLNAI